MKAAAEDEPARVSVVLDVTAERGDREHGVADGGPRWKWLLCHGHEHLKLFCG